MENPIFNHIIISNTPSLSEILYVIENKHSHSDHHIYLIKRNLGSLLNSQSFDSHVSPESHKLKQQQKKDYFLVTFATAAMREGK